MALLMPAGCRPSVNSSETTDGQTNPPTASDTTDGEGIREYEIPLTNTQGAHSLFFVFLGVGKDLFTVDDFRFEQVKA